MQPAITFVGWFSIVDLESGGIERQLPCHGYGDGTSGFTARRTTKRNCREYIQLLLIVLFNFEEFESKFFFVCSIAGKFPPRALCALIKRTLSREGKQSQKGLW